MIKTDTSPIILNMLWPFQNINISDFLLLKNANSSTELNKAFQAPFNSIPGTKEAIL